jgi:alpha-N-arabinofuranosidase
MITKKQAIIALLTGVIFSFNLAAQKIQPIVVTVDKPKSEIAPTMWGIFFEDINFGADGGLYAEMVKNRSFEFAKPRTGWQVNIPSTDSSHFVLQNRGIVNTANPRFARITIKDGSAKNFISNSGFRGMGVKQNNSYNLSVMAALPTESNIKLSIELIR